MIVLFGPAGAGKSVQGQFLAAREDWRWLSAGQLLRETHDPKISRAMRKGVLIPNDRMNKIMGNAMKRADNIDQIILDGWPRHIEQAKWLFESQPEHGHAISVVIVLEVARQELLHRLEIRGRADDTPGAIDERLAIYRKEMYPVLAYFTEQNVPVVHLNGEGTVGQVHDRIIAELQSRGLVK
jgi:adenylate kinase